jgi:hypothetical protein
MLGASAAAISGQRSNPPLDEKLYRELEATQLTAIY